jgi:SPP1 gp7 family putative phage head morphogenesis protein
LEARHARLIARALRSQLDAVLPPDGPEGAPYAALGKLTETEGPLRDALYAMLKDGALLGAARGRRAVEGVLGVKAAPDDFAAEVTIDWAGVDEDARQWASDYAYTLVRDIQATSARVLQSQLAEYFATTLTYRGLLDALAPTFGRQRAGVIATTEITRAAAEGELVSIRQSNGVIRRYRWFTGRDERVCPVCGPRHGEVYEVGKGPTPPAHVRCRCFISGTVKPLAGQPAEDEQEQAPAVLPAPKPIAWGEWKTIQEAEQAAHARFPNVRFDFTGAHLDTMDPTLRRFGKLAEEYPQVVERLEYLGTYGGAEAPRNQAAEGSWGSNTYAHATRDGKMIGLNPAFYGNPEKFRESVARSAQVGWHPKGTDAVDSVLTHEFGHQVENWLRSVPSDVAAFRYADVSGQGLVADTFRHWYDTHKATKALSQYATTNKAEGWAEGFAAQYHGTAAVRRQAYMRRQRALLDALHPSKWRHKGEWEWTTDVARDERAAAWTAVREWEKEFMQ